MTSRQSLSPMKRLAIFERAKGVCHLCGLKIQPGQKWDVEHPRALGLLGEDNEANMAPAHDHCHKPKTADDVGRIAKAKRVKAKHIGIRKATAFRKPDGFEYDWKRGRYVKETQCR